MEQTTLAVQIHHSQQFQQQVAVRVQVEHLVTLLVVQAVVLVLFMEILHKRALLVMLAVILQLKAMLVVMRLQLIIVTHNQTLVAVAVQVA